MACVYTAAVGRKFYKDGSVRPFPGNSIVSHLNPTDNQHGLLVSLQQELASAVYGSAFAILPAPSLHMTLFDLVCDQVRVPEHWSSFIPLDTSLEEVDKRLEALQVQVQRPSSLNMVFHHFELEKTIGTVLVPADSETETSLSSYREAISKVTGIRHPKYDTYFFHISLAYILRILNDEERAILSQWVLSVDERLKRDFGCLKLMAPEMVFFPDMYSFPRVRGK